jgi:hypothetical protein
MATAGRPTGFCIDFLDGPCHGKRSIDTGLPNLDTLIVHVAKPVTGQEGMKYVDGGKIIIEPPETFEYRLIRVGVDRHVHRFIAVPARWQPA